MTIAKFYLSAVLMLISIFGFSQGIVKGTAWDADMNDVMVGANVIEKGTSNGITTKLDGSFEISVSTASGILELSFMGYSTIEVPFSVSEGSVTKIGQVDMYADAVGLQEVLLVADVAVDRKTPVAVSTISSKQIQQELGSQELPEIMKTTPGVYATKSGGGVGDSKINIRGFSQENIAVMVNGIPVNDMENGKVYWSNWAGLSDATRSIQVQRGLGASKLAVNSVGGTMNILTKPSESEAGGFVEGSSTNYGMYKTKVGLSTGLLESGFAATMVLSKTQGTGYIEQTWANVYSYFFTASQKLGDNHTLLFTASGAPQVHGKRPGGKYSMFSYEDYETIDRSYNANWGYTSQSQLTNESENFYHKPQLGLNWIWHITDGQIITTSAYASFGSGGGSGIVGRGFSLEDGTNGNWKYNVPKEKFDDNGQFDDNGTLRQDWAKVIETNRQLAAEEKEGKGNAAMILVNSMNNHSWYGVLSTYKNELTDDLNLMVGIDARTYTGEHYRQVKDLLGANGWNDSKRSGNVDAQVGDIVDFNSVGKVSYGGLFSQLEYGTEAVSVFATASVSNNWYNRTDYFSYAKVENADEVTSLGYNFKLGSNYNLNDNNNVYVNLGYYSRAPFINAVFINYRNDVNKNLNNEKIIAGEVGYGFRSEKIAVKVNAYYTQWSDRYLSATYDYKALVDGDMVKKRATANFTDLSQTHIGIELEANYNISSYFDIGAFASVGNWEYTNDPTTDVVDSQDQTLIEKDVIVALDGLKVADAPQTQFGLTAKVKPAKGMFISANWNYNTNFYSSFDVKSRMVSEGVVADREQSFEIPSFNTLDMTVGYDFMFNTLDMYAGVNVYNVLDAEYMAEGVDGKDHLRENFVGFMGWGRNFNFTVRVNF